MFYNIGTFWFEPKSTDIENDRFANCATITDLLFDDF